MSVDVNFILWVRAFFLCNPWLPSRTSLFKTIHCSEFVRRPTWALQFGHAFGVLMQCIECQVLALVSTLTFGGLSFLYRPGSVDNDTFVDELCYRVIVS